MNPEISTSFGSEYHRVILNAMPCPVFVVEEEVRILDFNTAAGKLLNEQRERVLQRRIGEILHCLHATEGPEGCGLTPACAQCPIRMSVNCALGGEAPLRQTAKLDVLQDGQVVEALFLVTVAPFVFENIKLALLILEDVREMALLRQMLPICSHCKQVRDDKNYWQSVESYLSDHLEIDCTHSLCPDCAEALFPEFASAMKREGEQNRDAIPPGTPEAAL